MFLDRRIRPWLAITFGGRTVCRGIVVASVQPEGRRKSKETLHRLPERSGRTFGEVAAGGTKIRIEDRVAREHIAADLVAYVVWCVPGEMQDGNLQVADREYVAIRPSTIEGRSPLFSRYIYNDQRCFSQYESLARPWRFEPWECAFGID